LVPQNVADQPYKADYDASVEANFDPDIHLDLEVPPGIKIFGENDELEDCPIGVYKRQPGTSYSRFACSQKFQVFSEAGQLEMNAITKNLEVSHILENTSKARLCSWVRTFVQNLSYVLSFILNGELHRILLICKIKISEGE